MKLTKNIETCPLLFKFKHQYYSAVFFSRFFLYFFTNLVNFLLIGNDFTQLKSFFDKESLLLFQLSDLINRFLNYDLFEKFINLLDNLKKNSNLLLLFQKKFLHFYIIYKFIINKSIMNSRIICFDQVNKETLICYLKHIS